MDERAGTEEARRLGLEVTGTLGALARYAQLGWIDLHRTLKELRGTDFRIHPKQIRELLEVHYARARLVTYGRGIRGHQRWTCWQ
jgi:predicted nucleic acid-binding protein